MSDETTATEITPELIAELRRCLCGVLPGGGISLLATELATLLDAAEERDRLEAELDLYEGRGRGLSLETLAAITAVERLVELRDENTSLKSEVERLRAENENLKLRLLGEQK